MSTMIFVISINDRVTDFRNMCYIGSILVASQCLLSGGLGYRDSNRGQVTVYRPEVLGARVSSEHRRIGRSDHSPIHP